MLEEKGQSYRCQRIVKEISYEDNEEGQISALKIVKEEVREEAVQTRGQVLPREVAHCAESSSRRRVDGSPSGGTLGGDGALWGSSFLAGVVGRSQAALQEGKVEALTRHESRWFCVGETDAG